MPARSPRLPAPTPRSATLLGVLVVLLGLLLSLSPASAVATPQDDTSTGTSTGRGTDSSMLPPLFPTPAPGGSSDAEQVDERALANDFPRLPRRCGLLVDGQVPAQARRCVIKKAGRKDPVLVLWGDSHMWQMVPAIKRATRGQRVGLVAFFFGNCAPALPDPRIVRGNPCMETQELARSFVTTARRQGREVRVIVGAFWGAHLNKLAWYESPESRRTFAAKRDLLMAYTPPLFRWLGRNRVPTDIQVQGPAAIPPNPDCRPGPTPFQCDIPRRDAYFQERQVTSFLTSMKRRLPRGARLINTANGICTATVCPAVQPGGQHTWFDPYHLSASTTSTLSRFYVPTVRALVR